MAEKNIKPESGQTIKLANGKTVNVTKTTTIKLGEHKKITLANGTQIDLQKMMGGKVSDQHKNIEVKANETKEGNATEAEVKNQVFLFADGSEVQLREENVQEILTAVPNWMIRWGNTLFCSLILLLLFLAWMVKYPEVVSTQMILLNKFPSQEVRLDKPTKISEVLVAQDDEVENGDVLLVLKNKANYKDILLLQSRLDGIRLNSKSFDFSFYQLPILSLGDLQVPFARFEDSYLLYQNSKEQIKDAKEHIYKNTLNEKGEYDKNQVKADTKLFRQLLDDYQALKIATDEWTQKFVVKSSVAGKVAMVDIQKGQMTEVGKSLIRIDANETPVYIARLEIPSLNSGKVQRDQKVHLKLDNYPEMEFGMLEGRITKIEESREREEVAYIAEVALSEGLLTSYDKEITFNQNLMGTGEIIIKQSRLLEQFLSSINK